LMPEAIEDLKRFKARGASRNTSCTRNPFKARASKGEPQPHQAIARAPQATIPAPRRRGPVFYDVTETTVEVLAIVTKQEAESWLATIRKAGVKEVPLSEVKDDLSRYLREGRNGGDHYHAPRQAGWRPDRF